jgi:hypothetical protein
MSWLILVVLIAVIYIVLNAVSEGYAHPIISEALRPGGASWFQPYLRPRSYYDYGQGSYYDQSYYGSYYGRAPSRYGRVNTWNNRSYYGGRPFRYWTRYLAPSYYPTGGAYAYDLKEWYDPYDYTNDPLGDLCYARITIEDAFGPFTAGVMGKQAWLDFGTRHGFQKVYLPRDSVVNDHAIVEYIGQCNRAAQEEPPKSKYQVHRPLPQYY